MQNLNTLIDHLNNNLKDLIKSASKITIKTEQSVLVLTLKGNKIVTEVYESASLKKVGFHAIGSIKELCAVFEEMGLCIYKVARKLLVLKMFKQSKPLLLEFKPDLNSKNTSS